MLDLSSSRSRGRAGHRWPRSAWLSVLAVAGVLALGAPSASVAAARAAGPSPAPSTTAAASTYYSTTLSYVIRFYARFTSWYTERLVQKTGGMNTLLSAITGPSGLIGPPAALWPGPNVDTLYGVAGDLDLSRGPVILTIPPTASGFSVANFDIWGDYFTGVPAEPGTYALALPNWHGKLPPGVTRVNIPYPVTIMLLRAYRYTNGVNTIASSKAFIAGLHLAPLPAYKANHSSGPTRVLPQKAFAAFSTKSANDLAMRYTPTLYLRTLQTAMHSPTTRPLTPSDAAASKSFDTVFAAAQRALRHGNPVPLAQMARAVHNAYATVVSHFMTHTIGNSEWIYFNNVGQFGTDYLARDAIAEFAFGSNTPARATYYFAYTDACGAGLNTRSVPFYRLTFSKAEIPDAERFWSLTAYTPRAVRLIQLPGVRRIPPSAKNVAEYTPGLVTNPNGSITIYIQPKPPANPTLYPNWLPTPAKGPFLFWLRVYGPTGNTAVGQNYVPPAVRPLGQSSCGN
jgi:hypothetical protein